MESVILLVSEMSEKRFYKGLYVLIACFVLVIVSAPLGMYIATSDWGLSVFVLLIGVLLSLLAYLLYRFLDAYITGIVAELSRLVDVLEQLSEEEIFPDNQDTIVSKLQSKVIRLVNILRRNNELAKQEQQNIKSLVSDISHQLKTPISNLKMYSAFLKDDSLSERKRREYVEIVCISVERLYFLTEDMIKLSRLESGLIHLAVEKQSLNETILKAVKNIYPKAHDKGVEIIYREKSQIAIRHDKNWTTEAIFNLLDNAVKYAEKGSHIILTVERLGLFVQIAVEDENGPIPEEEQAKIFSRFYRGKNSRNQEGIGVGLYLAREIVVRQKGYMSLKTTDKGNVFSIMLYCEAGDNNCFDYIACAE